MTRRRPGSVGPERSLPAERRPSSRDRSSVPRERRPAGGEARSRGAPRGRPGDLVAFLGPSLPADEARALAPCRVLPPARAGDVFAVLPERPLAIALVDGLFDAVPSVWHHELLAALDAGVAVFGGGSMGALRAAELGRYGVVGIGRIFGWYRDGAVSDDGEVALLHAGPEHGYRAFTVPLVTVRAAAEAARAEGVLSRREAAALVRAASAIFYQERTWPRVLESAPFAPARREALRAFLPRAPDPKAEDARAVLAAAAAYVAARRAGAPPPPRPARAFPPAHVRRRQLAVAHTVVPGAARSIRSGEVLAALAARPDARRHAADGLRRALVASWARAHGLAAAPEEVDAAERAWLGQLGVAARERPAFLAACGLDDGAARRLAEDLALEARVLDAAERFVPDGPAWEEGLALAARLTGGWVEAAAAIAAAGPPESGARERVRARSSRGGRASGARRGRRTVRRGGDRHGKA